MNDDDLDDLERKFIMVLSQLNKQSQSIENWIQGFDTAFRLIALLNEAQTQSGAIAELEKLLTPEIGEKSTNLFVVSKDVNAIILTTMHASKGREFEYVILPVVQAGIIPNPTHDTKQADFDTLRNLMYVACTRAKKCVYILSSHSNTDLPMFVKDIPNLKFGL